MKKYLFPIQKLSMLFFYLELLMPINTIPYLICSVILLSSSIIVEGGRPYTPLLIFIVISQMCQWTIIQIIVIIVAGIATAAIKLYRINMPLCDKYMVGHQYYQFTQKNNSSVNSGDLLLSIFYPTLTKTSPVLWIANKNYMKVLYQIFHVDPKARRLPYYLFAFINSYINKIQMSVQSKAPYTLPEQNNNKVIIYSHGLGAHLNSSISIIGQWVSLGYVVVSVNHSNDEVCIDYRKLTDSDPVLIREYLYKYRNRDLHIRVKEVIKVIDLVSNCGILKECLGFDIQADEIVLAGHSYGGGTVLATKAEINRNLDGKSVGKPNISKLICLDPWMFPLNQDHYPLLKNESILIINSEHFFKQVPSIYTLQNLYSKLLQYNPQIQAFMIKGLDHLGLADMAYVFGNILKLTGSVKLPQLTDRFIALAITICSHYLQGDKKYSIMQAGNIFVQKAKMDMYKVKVIEQYRTTRQKTFEQSIEQPVQAMLKKI